MSNDDMDNDDREALIKRIKKLEAELKRARRERDEYREYLPSAEWNGL